MSTQDGGLPDSCVAGLAPTARDCESRMLFLLDLVCALVAVDGRQATRASLKIELIITTASASIKILLSELLLGDMNPKQQTRMIVSPLQAFAHLPFDFGKFLPACCHDAAHAGRWILC